MYVVCAVPPLASGSAVPEYVRASVPLDVTGLPETVNTAGADSATLVTVPVAVSVSQAGTPAVTFSTCPLVPTVSLDSVFMALA